MFNADESVITNKLNYVKKVKMDTFRDCFQLSYANTFILNIELQMRNFKNSPIG